MQKERITLEKLTLDTLFNYSVETYADRNVVSKVAQTPIRYKEMAVLVDDLIDQLRLNGIKQGDKVALLSENMPHWGVAYFAITTMGAIVVPILPDFHASEVHHILQHAECKALFVSKRLIGIVEEEKPENIEFVIRLNDLELIEALSTQDTTKEILLKKGSEQLNRLKPNSAKAKESDDESVRIKEDDVATIIYTSGTTGSSKGVILTHKSLVFETIAAQSLVDITQDDRFLSILPLAHTLECTIGFLIPVLNGSCVYYIDKVPTPRVLIDAMSQVKPTFIVSVPLIIEKIFKSKVLSVFQKNWLIRFLYSIPFIRRFLHRIAGKKLLKTFGGELKFFGIGGAALSKQVETFLEEAKFPYAIGYGLTETAPLLAGASPGKTRIGSTGPALEGVELKIDESTAKDGEGEILARGPNVMQGYYKDPERTAEVLDEEGWFHTGDLGYFDEEGYLFISGRSKNVIVGSGGENIYPEQIESIVNENELVMDSLVFDDMGKLVARIHLDYEKIDARFEGLADSQIHEKIEVILEKLRVEANAKVSSFSRMMRFIEQKEPFVKTPTKKIKRYLYING
ncbi:MAG: long-chain fatty acid--CoA ligase [Epsilonproteobacteria bacterium]|nr:MAG: long-chain fatty acid--CoA ligase [Campylobacterota bacterium]